MTIQFRFEFVFKMNFFFISLGWQKKVVGFVVVGNSNWYTKIHKLFIFTRWLCRFLSFLFRVCIGLPVGLHLLKNGVTYYIICKRDVVYSFNKLYFQIIQVINYEIFRKNLKYATLVFFHLYWTAVMKWSTYKDVRENFRWKEPNYIYT